MGVILYALRYALCSLLLFVPVNSVDTEALVFKLNSALRNPHSALGPGQLFYG